MTLKELEIGDRFVLQSQKYGDKFEVRTKPKFNIGHGSPTRVCYNENTKTYLSKSCRVNVIKLPFDVNKLSI